MDLKVIPPRSPPKSLKILDFVGKTSEESRPPCCQGAQDQFLGPSLPLEVKAERGWRKATRRGNLKPGAVGFFPPCFEGSKVWSVV